MSAYAFEACEKKKRRMISGPTPLNAIMVCDSFDWSHFVSFCKKFAIEKEMMYRGHRKT